MTEAQLEVPPFRYRVLYGLAAVLLFFGFVPVLAVSVFAQEYAHAIADDLIMTSVALELGIPILIALCAAWHGNHAKKYLDFRQRISGWALTHYDLRFTTQQLKRMATPTSTTSYKLFQDAPRPFDQAWPPYDIRDGWYVSNPIILAGNEATAPALRGRRKSIVLVSKGGRAFLVEVGSAEPLPEGQSLQTPFRPDPYYTPYSIASIVGLFALGAMLYAVLNVVVLMVLIPLHPDHSTVKFAVTLTLIPVLPFFYAASSRIRQNRYHR